MGFLNQESVSEDFSSVKAKYIEKVKYTDLLNYIKQVLQFSQKHKEIRKVHYKFECITDSDRRVGGIYTFMFVEDEVEGSEKLKSKLSSFSFRMTGIKDNHVNISLYDKYWDQYSFKDSILIYKRD